ncbi:M23 family metallopeptidase [Candidatus Daviesbacteria bacterium]|nr:M23 family metallopeptidase [Candidatus Daviesbacteria bacterium]
MNSAKDDLTDLLKFLVIYQGRKTKKAAVRFESFKNHSVNLLMHRRGKFQRHVWHASMVGLASIGLVSSGIFGGNDIVATTFPGMIDQDPRLIETFDPNASGISLNTLIDMNTIVSDKPRSEIIEYEVKSGETVSQIAEKYQISSDTVKWANNLDNVNSVKPGDKLKILPLTGVAHTVKEGETLEGVAKKYSASSQAVLDFPFNNVPDDLKLKVGQVIIIPDGYPPEVKAPKRPQPQYLAKGPSSPAFSAPGGGNFVWPAGGEVSQYFAWYHPGIDIANRSAPGIVSSDGGTVVVAGWPDGYGYGNRVVIDHGNGYSSLYGHLSNIYVSVGEKISRGQVIGQMGSTGRSTGIHLHLEIRFKGIAVNPLGILK